MKEFSALFQPGNTGEMHLDNRLIMAPHRLTDSKTRSILHATLRKEVNSMSNDMPEEEKEIYEEAKKRVNAKKDFYRHLGIYIVINIGLVLIWAFASGGGYPWFAWPLGIWGIFVVYNFLEAFVFSKRTARDKRAIEKEVERIRKERS